MRLHVKLTGLGTTASPVSYDAPTGVLVGYDPVTMMGVIEVPDDDAPALKPDTNPTAFIATVEGIVMHDIPAPALAVWQAKMRGKYGQNAKLPKIEKFVP